MKDNSQPDYKVIYTDILHKKYPHKEEECLPLLKKNKLSAIDVLELNRRIFGIADQETLEINQKHRSFSESDVVEILEYQKKNKLNNNQLAIHFKLSRNTVSKWKRLFRI